MPITAAFMVPHPPLIVPQVGRGGEKQVAVTIASYERAAAEIAALKPETIIISSPHSVMYADYFHISPGKGASGSFSRFGAPEVRFDEEYDTEFVDALEKLCRENSFPAGTMGERDPSLDHGTMVPLYFIRKKYPHCRIVRTGLSGLSLAEHYAFGQLIRKTTADIGRNVVYVASGDLSHKLQEYGPYGFAPEGPQYDERLMDVCSRADFGELLGFDEHFCNKAAECGHRSFVIMAGALDGTSVKAEVYSHEDVTGVGYGICSFIPEGDDPERMFLAKYLEKKKAAKSGADEYVRLARETVETFVRTGKTIKAPSDLPAEMKKERAGAFVSIHKLGQLRGCIGTILPTKKNIAEEIIGNAISAASRDPRFEPITADELEFLDINVDILSAPEPIASRDMLDVKRYGVIVSCGYKRGLLLPDLDGVDTVDEQISIAMRKGGISEHDDYTLERFEVIRHF